MLGKFRDPLYRFRAEESRRRLFGVMIPVHGTLETARNLSWYNLGLCTVHTQPGKKELSGIVPSLSLSRHTAPATLHISTSGHLSNKPSIPYY